MSVRMAVPSDARSVAEVVMRAGAHNPLNQFRHPPRGDQVVDDARIARAVKRIEAGLAVIEVEEVVNSTSQLKVVGCTGWNIVEREQAEGWTLRLLRVD